ncbi:hypothetical protein D3C73_1389660 [compost metagenome]
MDAAWMTAALKLACTDMFLLAFLVGGVFVDSLGAGVRQEQAADDAHHHHHDDRIHQTAKDIAAGLRQVGGGKGYDAAEDARADVVREG